MNPGELMPSRNLRLIALAVVLAGSAAIQACAVTTGGFTASREPRRSNFELLRQQSFSPVRSLHSMMTTTSEKPLTGYTYY